MSTETAGNHPFEAIQSRSRHHAASVAGSVSSQHNGGSRMGHTGGRAVPVGTPNTVVVDEDVILKYEERIRELERENAALKSKQVEVSTAKELYLKIFEDFPALIWRSRLDKLCDYFNRTWLEWTGKTFDQEFGNGWANGVHPDDFDRCLETYIKAFDKREPFYMEYRLINKYGEYRWIGDHGTPFFDLDDTFLGYIGSCYDITENKDNEQQLRKLNATKDKFFSILAHDLRNPIAAFISVSELLMDNYDEFEPEEMTEIAAQLHKDSKNTLLLLENLLEWSKAQSDEISYAPMPWNLTQVCTEAVQQTTMSAKAKKISLQYLPDQTLTDNLQFLADKNMLKTVLRNLLMNAIKFTESGGSVVLTAEWVPTESKEHNNDNKQQISGNFLITVSDNGVGIPENEIEGMFDLIKNARSRLGTEDEGGSGLGLVLCKDFVERHGGKIWAESQVGKGTKVKFTIPYPPATSQ